MKCSNLTLQLIANLPNIDGNCASILGWESSFDLIFISDRLQVIGNYSLLFSSTLYFKSIRMILFFKRIENKMIVI